ncbi:MAG: SDR family oxidoreductase [Alphaproteobacteria bacterium]|nr:SDR family oxidoreductase [Alphaproteobacteria bacterium]
MKLELKDKVVLVTGGSKGIGLACAKAFLDEGAKVGITSRSQANIDMALGGLKGAVGIAGDLIDASQAETVVDGIEKALGPIDVLVNSAGAAKRTAPDDLTPAAWRAAMDAKYFSYVNVFDPVVKRMGKRGAGVIVNIIGNGGKIASPTHIAGGAANAALMLATAGLANAYAGKGVRVVGINPGLTNTQRVAEGLKSDAKLNNITEDEALKRAIQRIPMGRMAEPEEIANLVLFLASPRASYVNGVIISMDGMVAPIVV